MSDFITITCNENNASESKKILKNSKHPYCHFLMYRAHLQPVDKMLLVKLQGSRITPFNIKFVTWKHN